MLLEGQDTDTTFFRFLTLFVIISKIWILFWKYAPCCVKRSFIAYHQKWI